MEISVSVIVICVYHENQTAILSNITLQQHSVLQIKTLNLEFNICFLSHLENKEVLNPKVITNGNYSAFTIWDATRKKSSYGYFLQSFKILSYLTTGFPSEFRHVLKSTFS